MSLQLNLSYFFQTLLVGFGALFGLYLYVRIKIKEYDRASVESSFDEDENPSVLTADHVLLSSECRGADIWHVYIKDFTVVEVLHQKNSPGCLT